MYRIKKNTIDVKEISKFLDVEYSGDNFQINTISSLNDPKDNSILFFFFFFRISSKLSILVE